MATDCEKCGWGDPDANGVPKNPYLRDLEAMFELPSCLNDAIVIKEESLVYSSSSSEAGDMDTATDALVRRKQGQGLHGLLLSPRGQEDDDEEMFLEAKEETELPPEAIDHRGNRYKNIPSLIQWSASDTQSYADDVSVLYPPVPQAMSFSRTLGLSSPQQTNRSRSILTIGGSTNDTSAKSSSANARINGREEQAPQQEPVQRRPSTRRFLSRMWTRRSFDKRKGPDAADTTPEKENDGLVWIPGRKSNSSRNSQASRQRHGSSRTSILHRLVPKSKKPINKEEYAKEEKPELFSQTLLPRVEEKVQKEVGKGEEICIEFFNFSDDDSGDDDINSDEPTAPTVSTAPTSCKGKDQRSKISATEEGSIQRNFQSGKESSTEQSQDGVVNTRNNQTPKMQVTLSPTSAQSDNHNAFGNANPEVTEPDDIDGILGDLVGLMEEMETELKNYDIQQPREQPASTPQTQEEQPLTQLQQRGVSRKNNTTRAKTGATSVMKTMSAPVLWYQKCMSRSHRNFRFQKLHRKQDQQGQDQQQEESLIQQHRERKGMGCLPKLRLSKCIRSKQQRSRPHHHHHNGRVYSAVE